MRGLHVTYVVGRLMVDGIFSCDRVVFICHVYHKIGNDSLNELDGVILEDTQTPCPLSLLWFSR